MATESKLITLDNLQDAIGKILELLDTKADIDGEPRFTGVRLLYGEDSYWELVVDDNSDTPEIAVITDDEPKVLAINYGENIATKHIDTDEITTSDWEEPGSEVYYCLPTSSANAKTKATTTINGGGTILTTRYRNYEYATDTLTYRKSIVVKPFVYFKVNVNTGGSVAISLDGLNSGMVNEYWIELNINGNFAGTENAPVMFYQDSDLRWVGDEPDWTTLQGKTVQIHIMNKIANYVIVNNA